MPPEEADDLGVGLGDNFPGPDPGRLKAAVTVAFDAVASTPAPSVTQQMISNLQQAIAQKPMPQPSQWRPLFDSKDYAGPREHLRARSYVRENPPLRLKEVRLLQLRPFFKHLVRHELLYIKDRDRRYYITDSWLANVDELVGESLWHFVHKTYACLHESGDPERPQYYHALWGVDLTEPEEEEDTMLEQLLKLYTMYMATGATSPMPHFVGPPGSGKSSVFKQAADLLNVRVHTINVSRISPLELEGVQMPNTEHTELNLLHATLWTQLQDGDIVLLDEFLRGFPEVYNGLLDILTAREVGGLQLPKVFIAGASNSTVTYDSALEDRLLHITVPDARAGSAEKGRLAWLLVDTLGLDPRVKNTDEMDTLLETEVLPMYDMLDTFTKTQTVTPARVSTTPASSLRKLIGQAQLRHVQSPGLQALIDQNNVLASQKGKHHYMFLLSGKNVPGGYKGAAIALEGALDQLTPLQRTNRELNLQLIEMEETKAKAKREDTAGDD